MDAVAVIADGIGRVRQSAAGALDGIDAAALSWQPDSSANTIAWLVWHLARVQDDHVADVAGTDEVWDGQDWARRFGLPAGTRDTGFGHGPEDVRAVRPEDTAPLVAYLEAVTDATTAFLDGTTADDLDRVVDERWDPPVTLGVRLVSVIGDGLQHAGQAAYVRGLWERCEST